MYLLGLLILALVLKNLPEAVKAVKSMGVLCAHDFLPKLESLTVHPLGLIVLGEVRIAFSNFRKAERLLPFCRCN